MCEQKEVLKKKNFSKKRKNKIQKFYKNFLKVIQKNVKKFGKVQNGEKVGTVIHFINLYKKIEKQPSKTERQKFGAVQNINNI